MTGRKERVAAPDIGALEELFMIHQPAALKRFFDDVSHSVVARYDALPETSEEAGFLAMVSTQVRWADYLAEVWHGHIGRLLAEKDFGSDDWKLLPAWVVDLVRVVDGARRAAESKRPSRLAADGRWCVAVSNTQYRAWLLAESAMAALGGGEQSSPVDAVGNMISLAAPRIATAKRA